MKNIGRREASPIFFIHVANPIFSGFTRKKLSNICIIMSQNLTWINVWKVNTFVSQMIQNSCSKSNIVQTTCNSSNSTVQQIEQRALWSQTTLGTMKSEGNYQKCWFWVENALEPNKTGNHNKWKELRKMFIFEQHEQKALRSQTTLETITREPPKIERLNKNLPKFAVWSLFREVMVNEEITWDSVPCACATDFKNENRVKIVMVNMNTCIKLHLCQGWARWAGNLFFQTANLGKFLFNLSISFRNTLRDSPRALKPLCSQEISTQHLTGLIK